MDAEREAAVDAADLVDAFEHFLPMAHYRVRRAHLVQMIAAALRRARAAGRREAVEECARVAYAAGCDNPLCLLCVGHGLAAKIRALAAGAGEQKEGEG